MRILLPTGSATVETVKKAAAGFDAEVRITGEIASFLTPHALRTMILEGTLRYGHRPRYVHGIF